MKIAKLSREIARLPLVALCVIGGSWTADFLWPQGMSYGEPLADRFGHAFQLSSYPPELLLVVIVLAASLLFLDWVTPHESRTVVSCVGGLFAGALYYELFLGGFIDTLFAEWPSPVGELLALSSLLWAHFALLGVKLTLAASRMPTQALPPAQEAR